MKVPPQTPTKAPSNIDLMMEAKTVVDVERQQALAEHPSSMISLLLLKNPLLDESVRLFIEEKLELKKRTPVTTEAANSNNLIHATLDVEKVSPIAIIRETVKKEGRLPQRKGWATPGVYISTEGTLYQPTHNSGAKRAIIALPWIDAVRESANRITAEDIHLLWTGLQSQPVHPHSAQVRLQNLTDGVGLWYQQGKSASIIVSTIEKGTLTQTNACVRGFYALDSAIRHPEPAFSLARDKSLNTRKYYNDNFKSNS